VHGPTELDAASIARGLEVELAPTPEPADLGREWCELLDRSNASFFLSWPWISCWLTGRARTTRLARVAARGTTVGLALLAERTGRVGPLAIRSWHLHATGDTAADRIAIEHNDLLAARGYEAAARFALLRRLLGRESRGPRAIVLPMVGEPWEAAARAVGLPVRRRAESRCAVVDLEAARRRQGGYLGGLGASTRAQIRRAAKLYGKRGMLRLEAAADRAQALAWLDALGGLHEARFRSKGEQGAFGVPGFLDFHRALVTAAWESGTVELLQVSAGGAPIGYLYNFLWRGWVGFYSSGLAYEGDNRLKPGLVAHWLAVERYMAAGASVYDLMAGESRYKSSLAEPGPLLLGLVVERDDAVARIARAMRRLRDALRSDAGRG
jgi:CelD/BcsL family acetyltransferase involved in cellulose biosynthesis